MPLQQQRKSKCTGYGLLEVIVTLFILSFSLLSLANLTTVAWRRAYDSYFTSLAVGMAINRMEAAYAHDTYIYHKNWQYSVVDILPQGQGTYFVKKGGNEVKVCWQQLFHKYNLCYVVEA